MSARAASRTSVLLMRYLKSPDLGAACMDDRRADANFRRRKTALMVSTTAIELK